MGRSVAGLNRRPSNIGALTARTIVVTFLLDHPSWVPTKDLKLGF